LTSSSIVDGAQAFYLVMRAHFVAGALAAGDGGLIVSPGFSATGRCVCHLVWLFFFRIDVVVCSSSQKNCAGADKVKAHGGKRPEPHGFSAGAIINGVQGAKRRPYIRLEKSP
jgi:hypothetical protein